MNRLRTLLVLTAALALTPQAAQAFTPQAHTAQAQQIAAQHIGTPCQGQVTVSWAHLGANVNATNLYHWPFPDAAPDAWTDCQIILGYDVRWDWPKLCTVIEHETGHLLGWAHSPNTSSVMYATYEGPTAECTPVRARAAARRRATRR